MLREGIPPAMDLSILLQAQVLEEPSYLETTHFTIY